MNTKITSYAQRIECQGFKFLTAVQGAKANYHRDIQTFAGFLDTEEEIMAHADREFSKLSAKQQKEVMADYNG